LKSAVIAGEITVNTAYLPANDRIFSIMFYHKELSETLIRAVVGEDITITDPLAEHRNDILKAIESSIRVDVYLKDETARVYTRDMQRHYLKTRNRNRNIYYGSKELAGQEVQDCRYEKLKQVSITFIFENNTTPQVPPVSKIQFTDVNTKEVYSDLMTLYEVNLNRISDKEGLPENLVIVKAFLSITTHKDLCAFVNNYDTAFSQRLVKEYMGAILDDEILLKIEGSERFMLKLSEQVLLEEREEGRVEGRMEGRVEGRMEEARAIAKNMLKRNRPISEIVEDTGLTCDEILTIGTE
jgi:predicted transposase/invertase (TIGR01784 family)